MKGENSKYATCSCKGCHNQVETKYKQYSSSSDNDNDDNDDDEYFDVKEQHCYSSTNCKEADNQGCVIDDETWKTLLALRQKACKFLNSDAEELSGISEGTPESDDFYNGPDFMKKAKTLVDYEPESAFLRKIKENYLQKNEIKNVMAARSNNGYIPAMFESCACKSKQIIKLDKSPNRLRSGTELRPENSRGTECKCTSQENIKSHSSEIYSARVLKPEKSNIKQEYNGKENQNQASKAVRKSRSKKRTLKIYTKITHSQNENQSEKPDQAKKASQLKKPKSAEATASQEDFEPSLKRPHENSCERCWRYASNSRSPVNKPDQRYDPNFRKAHSCTEIVTPKGGEGNVERHVVCKNLEPLKSSDLKDSPVKKQRPHTAQLPIRTSEFSKHSRVREVPQTPPPYTEVKEASYGNVPPAQPQKKPRAIKSSKPQKYKQENDSVDEQFQRRKGSSDSQRPKSGIHAPPKYTARRDKSVKEDAPPDYFQKPSSTKTTSQRLPSGKKHRRKQTAKTSSSHSFRQQPPPDHWVHKPEMDRESSEERNNYYQQPQQSTYSRHRQPSDAEYAARRLRAGSKIQSPPTDPYFQKQQTIEECNRRLGGINNNYPQHQQYQPHQEYPYEQYQPHQEYPREQSQLRQEYPHPQYQPVQECICPQYQPRQEHPHPQYQPYQEHPHPQYQPHQEHPYPQYQPHQESPHQQYQQYQPHQESPHQQYQQYQPRQLHSPHHHRQPQYQNHHPLPVDRYYQKSSEVDPNFCDSNEDTNNTYGQPPDPGFKYGRNIPQSSYQTYPQRPKNYEIPGKCYCNSPEAVQEQHPRGTKYSPNSPEDDYPRSASPKHEPDHSNAKYNNHEESPRPRSPVQSSRPQSPSHSPRPQSPSHSPRPQSPSHSPRPQSSSHSPRRKTSSPKRSRGSSPKNTSSQFEETQYPEFENKIHDTPRTSFHSNNSSIRHASTPKKTPSGKGHSERVQSKPSPKSSKSKRHSVSSKRSQSSSVKNFDQVASPPVLSPKASPRPRTTGSAQYVSRRAKTPRPKSPRPKSSTSKSPDPEYTHAPPPPPQFPEAVGYMPQMRNQPMSYGQNRIVECPHYQEPPSRSILMQPHPVKECKCSFRTPKSKGLTFCCHCNERFKDRPENEESFYENPEPTYTRRNYHDPYIESSSHMPPKPHNYHNPDYSFPVNDGSRRHQSPEYSNHRLEQEELAVMRENCYRECLRKIAERCRGRSPQMNRQFTSSSFDSNPPRKYSVFYMTKSKEGAGNEVEVIVEELTEDVPNSKDPKGKPMLEKMKKVMDIPSESMALRFQKGVQESNENTPSSRVLYF